MATTASKRRWIWKVVRVVAIVEIAYLILINLALQAPATQTFINVIKPEKFEITWERAWTWYPFRVHVLGVSVNGQSRSQQWQFDAPSVAASISILPLALKRVWIRNVTARDISYKQRPRLKRGKDYTELIPFFPEIEGRDINRAVDPPKKKKRPWHLAINDISISGKHRYWLMQFKGALEGQLGGDLRFESAGGPFSLDNGELDLSLETLYVNNDSEVFNEGVVKGTLELAPFVPRENKGVNLLRFLAADADISIDSNSLAFIKLFTRNINQVEVDGVGRVAAHVSLEQGKILPGTNIAVDADNLLVDIMGHHIEGEGTLHLVAGESSDDSVNLAIQYAGLEVTHAGDDSPVLKGKQLSLDILGPNSLFEMQRDSHDYRNMRLAVESLSVPDLALLQHYLPEKWPFNIYAGEGLLQATVSLSTNALDIDLELSSQSADLGAGEYRFQSDLEAGLKLTNPSVSSGHTSIAGSFIKLTDAGLSRDLQEDIELWNASLLINNGHFSLLPVNRKQDAGNLTDLLVLSGQSGGKELLTTLHGLVDFESSVSSLGWLGKFLNNDYGFRIDGSGAINGVINLDDGLPAPGTDISVLSDDLAVDILDYTSHGTGKISMQVEKGDIHTDWLMDLQLHDADLMRQNELRPYIKNVNLSVAARIEDIGSKEKNQDSSLTFRILSAHVSDLSIFNSYLPANAPLKLTRGTASLAADILLQRESAQGWLTLNSKDLEFILDDQSVRSDFAANITLAGGVPAEMIFDIAGSELQLNDVRVWGENQTFDNDQWSAKLQLVRGEALWKKPLRLDAEARVQLLDSRPFVAMFSNRRKSPGWLRNMLTVRDIEGHAKLSIANETITIPLAHITADKIEVGGKGRISAHSRDGVFYAKYKKLDVILKVSDGRKNIDVIRAREKYDAYPETP